jgi:hypothetical protein
MGERRPRKAEAVGSNPTLTSLPTEVMQAAIALKATAHAIASYVMLARVT